MFTAIHIAIAILGLMAASWAWLKPGGFVIITSWMLAAATIATGIGLCVAHPASLGHLCVSGLTYLGAASAMTARGNLLLKRITVKA